MSNSPSTKTSKRLDEFDQITFDNEKDDQSSSSQIDEILSTVDPLTILTTPTTATISIKAAYSVRNISINNEADITTVMAINLKTKWSFYKDENWWKNQINLARQALFTKIPYVWAKKAKVCDLRAPQIYDYFNGQTQAQELQQVHFPIDDNELTILPTPTRSKEGIYRIKISFEAYFGPDE